MLDNNPRLLLYAGNTTTRGGFIMTRSTLLECAVYSGNPYAVELLLPYFEKIEKGDLIKKQQLNSFRPFIKSLKVEIKKSVCNHYNVESLIELIKISSPQDVSDALNKNRNNDSALARELNKFRESVRSCQSKKGMHYKFYGALATVFNWQASNWLPEDQYNLVWRQIVGYLQLFLPDIDRFAFAGGFRKNYDSLVILGSQGNVFPNAPKGTDSWTGLGFDYAICGARVDGIPIELNDALRETSVMWENHLEEKIYLLERVLDSQPKPDEKPGSTCPIM